MKSAIYAMIALLLCVACGPGTPTSAPPTATPEPRSTPIPLPTLPKYSATPLTVIRPQPVFNQPEARRTNWLLLGQDWRPHREGTGRGYQTDVQVLVSVLGTDPIQITAVQLPRNLYLPVESYPPTWLFSVWNEHGWDGLRDYYREAFGVLLDGIFMVDMDGFIQILNDLGLDGEETLEFLRDNQNNWSYGTYDKEERVFQALRWIWNAAEVQILSDPIATFNVTFGRWGSLIDSDLPNIGAYLDLFRLAWQVRSDYYDVRFVQLEEPAITWGPVPSPPLNVPKGMIPAVDLQVWMWSCAFEAACE